MDTDHMDMDTMDTAHTDMATIMERGLLMLSPLPKPLPTLRLRLILGTDTTDMDTGHMDMDTMDTGHMDIMDMDTTAHTDMDTTMERGLLMLSPMPILGTDTTDTGHMDMDTMDTAHTDMLTGVKLKPTTTCCFSLPTLL